MPKKTKATVKAVKLGEHGAILQIHGSYPGIGRLRNDIHVDVDTDMLGQIAASAFEQQEKALGAMDFDIEDPASVEAWCETYKQGMVQFWAAVRREVTT